MWGESFKDSLVQSVLCMFDHTEDRGITAVQVVVGCSFSPCAAGVCEWHW